MSAYVILVTDKYQRAVDANYLGNVTFNGREPAIFYSEDQAKQSRDELYGNFGTYPEEPQYKVYKLVAIEE